MRVRTPDGDDGEEIPLVDLALLFDGEPRLFEPAPIGDWLDLRGALSLLNELVAVHGRSERFVTPHTCDQTAMVFLGHGEKLRAVE